MPTLTQPLAEQLARIALGHVRREYPNKLDHVLAGPEDLRSPRALHPVFFGSFDWHSCVHSFWLLARLLRLFPDMAPAAEIRRLFDGRLTPTNIDAETAYLGRQSARGFERPYGWAWLLALAHELDRHAAAWGSTIAPLAERFARRFVEFLPRATYPVRAGTHGNTAFALTIAADYAEARADGRLLALFRASVDRWYGNDRDCRGWEPDGEDFLSPALTEAACMQRLLPSDAFVPWLDGFLPALHEGRPSTLFAPVTPSDRADGRIAHLDGLNFSRAWCWRRIAKALPDSDPRRFRARTAAEAHIAQSLPFLATDYMGEHWLATFALLALEDGERA